MVQAINNILKKIDLFLRKQLPTKNIGAQEVLPTSSQLPQQTNLTQNQLDFIKKYDGKLLLRREILVDDETFNDLLNRHYFTAVKSFIRKSLFNRCVRCNNSNKALLGKIPCARCNKLHIYCRNCIMMGRVSTCELLYKWTGPPYPWKKHEDACTWKGELTFAQNQAALEVEKAVIEEREQLIWAVTGAGKTEILFPAINRALSQGKRICIATPRADVVRELLPRIQAAFKKIPVQALYGNSRDREGTAQIIIATTHQLIRFKQAFDLLIIDEIDAFPYHNDKTLQFATNRAVKDTSSKIYLTATPRQALKEKLVMKQLAYCFVPIRYHGHPLPVPISRGDYSLSKQLQNHQLPKSFINWIKKRKRKDRQLLIFVPTISLAEGLVKSIRDSLILHGVIRESTAIVSVHAEDRLREQKIERFRNKELHVLVTTTILERGVTFPSIDVVVIEASHRVFDEASLVQIAGRAGRNAGDPEGEVIFIHDGKTEAIVRAITSIKEMNRRGKKLLQDRQEDK